MIVPGFGGFKRSSRKIRNALAQNEEFAAVSYEPSRHGGIRNDLLAAQKVHIDTVNVIIQDLADNQQLQDIPASHDIDYDRVVLVPHSMGGLPAVEHAYRHPEDVSRIILMATVGSEAAVKLGFVPRLGFSVKNELVPSAARGKFGGIKDGGIMLSRAVKYYGSNPVRTVGEIASCMLADQREKIEALGELGVKTALYLLGSDELIPAERSASAAGDLVDYVEIAEGLNHLAPQTCYEQVATDVSRISQYLAGLITPSV
jgi:pimeloyl-ACP methyl ester carboxylesterase